MTMIADHITVIGRGMTTTRVVIAYGDSGVSSVLEEMTTEEISAAIEEGWMTHIGEAVAMTTAGIFAALGERGLEKQATTGTGEAVAIAIE